MTPPCRQKGKAPLLQIATHGVVLNVSIEDDALQSSIIELLPPGCVSTHSLEPQRRYSVSRDYDAGLIVSINDEEPVRWGSHDAMLEFLEGDIQLFVAEFARPHLFMHAGVVAWNGTAILLPGRSFAGKSTLVTSLVRAGATYYSDEYAVLDANGRVLPYPRRVSLRPGPHGPGGRLDLSVHAPSGEAARTPIPVSMVALLRYGPSAGWDVRELDFLPAIMAMSEQMVAIRRRPEATMESLRQIARSTTVIEGTRGDVDDAVDRILGHYAAIPT